MRWLVVFLFMSSPVFANSATTSNVLPNLSTFTTSGSTTSSSTSGCTAGEFCTGNSTAGGGTYTSSFSVPLTKAEVQRGFDLNSAVTVNSHVSNSRLATCTSVTQAGDCRDIFTLGITLLDGDAVAKKFTHEVELDFTGNRLFSFSDSIAANSFGILTGSFSLFGIDAGFHSGFYGPKFSDPSLTFTYEQIVEQQIIDQIAQNDLIAAAPPLRQRLRLLWLWLPRLPLNRPLHLKLLQSKSTSPLLLWSNNNRKLKPRQPSRHR